MKFPRHARYVELMGGIVDALRAYLGEFPEGPDGARDMSNLLDELIRRRDGAAEHLWRREALAELADHMSSARADEPLGLCGLVAGAELVGGAAYAAGVNAANRLHHLGELAAHLEDLLRGVARFLDRPPYGPDPELRALKSRLAARLLQVRGELAELEGAPSSAGRER